MEVNPLTRIHGDSPGELGSPSVFRYYGTEDHPRVRGEGVVDAERRAIRKSRFVWRIAPRRAVSRTREGGREGKIARPLRFYNVASRSRHKSSFNNEARVARVSYRISIGGEIGREIHGCRLIGSLIRN